MRDPLYLNDAKYGPLDRGRYFHPCRHVNPASIQVHFLEVEIPLQYSQPAKERYVRYNVVTSQR